MHDQKHNPNINIKEIVNVFECIVELYKHAGTFKNSRELHREAQGIPECFLHFLSVFKNSLPVLGHPPVLVQTVDSTKDQLIISYCTILTTQCLVRYERTPMP